MTEITYNILISKNGKKELKPIDGYLYEKGGFWFGIDKRYKNHWQITELRTGRSIGCGIPRLKDADTVITDEMIETLHRILDKLPEEEFVNYVE